jgi:RNA polymerase sigma factor (sigma-70 family)
MREYNDGIGEDNILHNQFTAYLLRAIRNRKIQYLQQKTRLQSLETALELQLPFFALRVDDGEDPLVVLPVIERLENYRLQQALKQTTERDLYILFARALMDRPFAEIALELGMKLKTVTSVYYRLIERLRKELRGDDK